MLSSIDTSATPFASASLGGYQSPSHCERDGRASSKQYVHVVVSLADLHEPRTLKPEATVRAADVKVLDDLDESPPSGTAIRDGAFDPRTSMLPF